MRTEALYLDNREVIWETASQDVPILREQISAILAAEFPDEEGSTRAS